MTLYTNKNRVPFQIEVGDFESVFRYTWSLSKNGYPITNAPRAKLLHNFLMGRAPDGFEWDHENKDKLDNRRKNLRAVTRAINMRNRIRGDCPIGIPGVYPTRFGTWKVHIGIGGSGKYKFVGTFKTLDAAIEARRNAERKYWQ